MALLASSIPGYLHYGPWRLPLFGLFAAAGLVLALLVSQRTAVPARLSAARLWDAGMFAVLAAFLSSRLLLVFRDPAAFRRYPLLVLALPSLTYGGLLLTAVLVALWLRWKKLPLLDVADAWTPCAMLLWAVLSLGHFVEGTDAGMPSGVFWALRTAGDTVLGRVHPVQLYTAAFALALGIVLWMKLPARKRAGDILIAGLIAGGAGSFLLDMLRQPEDTYGNAYLDPSQWIAIGAILAGGVLLLPFADWFRKKRETPTREEVAGVLDVFIRDRGAKGLDAVEETLLEPQFSDPLLLEIQDRVANMPQDYPSDDPRYPYCSEHGLELVRWYLVQLRSEVDKPTRKVN